MSSPRLLALPLAVALALTACSGSGSSASTATTPSPPASSPAGSASGPASSPSSSLVPAGSPLAGKSADQIWQASMSAFSGSSSVTITGTAPVAGQRSTVSLVLSRAGNAYALLHTRRGDMRMIVTGRVVYLTGDDAFWRANHLDASALHGKWLRGDQDSPLLKRFVPLARLSYWSSTVLRPQGGLSLASQPRRFGSVTSVGLVDDAGDRGTLWVATAASPVPLAARSADGGTDLRMSRYGAKVTITQPAGVVVPLPRT